VNDCSFLRYTPDNASQVASDSDFQTDTGARSYAPGARTNSTRRRATPAKDSNVSAIDMEKLAGSNYSDELASILSDATTSKRIKSGEFLEDPRLLYRLHTYEDQQAKTRDQLESSSLRRLAELLKPTLRYTCTVQGHRDPHSGSLWAVNTIAEVSDDIEQVQEALWCVSRTFRFTAGSGRTTQLEFWRPSTFQI
jgi:prophage tail gpP-like protein